MQLLPRAGVEVTWQAIVLVLLAVAGWRISVAVWPHRRCPRCGGSGRGLGSNADRWSVCGRCGGSKVVRRR